VIDFKVDAMVELGATSPVALRSIGIDLRYDWPEALTDNGFHADLQTAWIAEGLLGYLTPQDQDRFLRIVTGLSAPGSMLALDWQPDLAVAITERSRAGAGGRGRRQRHLGHDLSGRASPRRRLSDRPRLVCHHGHCRTTLRT
jgi:methyltransferase (TIGR00027 family)